MVEPDIAARAASMGDGETVDNDAGTTPPSSDRDARAVSYQTSPIATGLRIVVADDNRDAAETLSLLLELRGHVVVTVNDGEVAIAAFMREPPDAMILDLEMPKVSGHEACRSIRAQPEGGRVVMVALTGWGQATDRERSLVAGFDVHLVKPVPHEVLLHAIERRP